MKNNTFFLPLMAALSIFAHCGAMDMPTQKFELPVQPYATVPQDIKYNAEINNNATQKDQTITQSKHSERCQNIEMDDNAFAHFLMCISPQLKIDNYETQNAKLAKKDRKKNCAVAPKKVRTIQAQIERLVQKRLKAKEKAEKTVKQRSQSIKKGTPYPSDFHYDATTHTFSLFMDRQIIKKMHDQIQRYKAQYNRDDSDDFFDPEIFIPKATKNFILFPFDSQVLKMDAQNNQKSTADLAVKKAIIKKNQACEAGTKKFKFRIFEDSNVRHYKVK